MSKKIIITGAAGFVGVNLSHYLLSKGYTVIGIDVHDRHQRLQYSELLKNNNYTFKQINLAIEKIPLDQDLSGSDAIYHLAALPHVDYSKYYPHQVITNNVESLLSTIEFACQENIPLILASSVEVYGGSIDRIYKETDIPAPLSPYAASKVASEAIVKSYIETQNLSATTFRFTNLYGPWQAPDRLIPRVIAQLLADIPITIEKGTNRDFVYIQDACIALERALQSAHSGEIINLASGARMDNHEVAQMILQKMSSKNVDIIEPRSRDGRGKYLVSSPDKITKILGWRPTVSIIEGLVRTIDWYGTNNEWLCQFEKNLKVDRSDMLFLTDNNQALI